MESESFKLQRSINIRNRINELRQQGIKTSKGEPMSMAAIGRTIDPPVNRVSVYYVVDGRSVSWRIRTAIEKELKQAYWIRSKTA